MNILHGISLAMGALYSNSFQQEADSSLGMDSLWKHSQAYVEQDLVS